jgi:predicted DNA binding CopG/RHH family protein
MATLDSFEQDLLADYEAGSLKSIATKSELAKLKAAARATATKDRRVNIRLSSGDLQDIQARALQEGMPYQTLIASILHKYVTGRLEERSASESKAVEPKVRTSRQARKADA